MTNPDGNFYIVRTLGCKANLYDSQLIEAELQKRGWRPAATDGSSQEGTAPRLCIVNSCTVTDEADRQSRKLASRLGRDNPRARVVVTGCGAEVDPERLARSPGIHYVVGNQDKPRMVDLILEKLAHEAPQTGEGEVLGSVLQYEQMLSRHPMDREWPAPEISFATPPVHLMGHSGKTRAFLKIQEGCNSFCTYCIIPYGRGPSRSLKPREIVEQSRALVAQGIREIIVTGTNIGDYGVDWGMDPRTALTELFEQILADSGVERLRVGSLDPTEITAPLLSLMERDPRFCPHFHVSLQAMHSRVLRLMKRKYGADEARACLERIAMVPAPLGGPFVGMDVITGFPGETAAEFEAGYEELSRLPWSRLHVFPYSEREGTPATRLPGAVRPEERSRRAGLLQELSLRRQKEHLGRVLEECRGSGRALEGVLLEKPVAKAPSGADASGVEGPFWASGYTANYLRVFVPVSEAQAQELRNQIVSAVPEALSIDSAQGDVGLIARLRSDA
jgi:threonylcarbamoyladenosine tRNA methylthiotransferase MtaB